MHLLETEKFSDTFGPKAQRKKPTMKFGSIDDLIQTADSMLGELRLQFHVPRNSFEIIIDNYAPEKDQSCLENVCHDGTVDEAKDPIFSKGQSKRIWNELYKVIDSSDVVLHVLDARDPEGTRCRNVEKYLKHEAKHKHLVFVLNKCDLVPTWVTVRFFH